MTLVVDASVATSACLTATGLAALPESDLVAPPLMWSETRSALHELLWRGELTSEDALAAVESLETAPVRLLSPGRLGSEAWRIADELGWAKTYDAEYVALAVLLGCHVVTLDARLHRGARRLGVVVTPEDPHLTLEARAARLDGS